MDENKRFEDDSSYIKEENERDVPVTPYGNQAPPPPYGDQAPPPPYGNQAPPPPYGNQVPPDYGNYYDQMPEQKGQNGFGIASLVLGIVSIVLFCTCVNWVTAVLAIIFGILQIAKGGKKGTAVAGIVTAALSMLFTVILYVVLFFMGVSGYGGYFNDYYDGYYDDYDDYYGGHGDYYDDYYGDFYDYFDDYYDDYGGYYDYYDDYYDDGDGYFDGGSGGRTDAL